MQLKPIEIKGKLYTVRVYFEKRKNSRVSITKTGINIRIPHFLRREDKIKTINELKNWVAKKIQENPQKFKAKKQYKDGDVLRLLEQDYILNIQFSNKKSSSAKIFGNNIYFLISENMTAAEKNEHIIKLLSRILGSANLKYLTEKIHTLNEKYFGQNINKITFKNLNSRWGSCSSKNNINISTKLLLAPEEILDYVCIHELAHLIEQNHSREFWKLVEKAMPDYRAKINWLKKNGLELEF